MYKYVEKFKGHTTNAACPISPETSKVHYILSIVYLLYYYS